jgi:hypothetical protein
MWDELDRRAKVKRRFLNMIDVELRQYPERLAHFRSVRLGLQAANDYTTPDPHTVTRRLGPGNPAKE